jgi:hypothetical protein
VRRAMGGGNVSSVLEFASCRVGCRFCRGIGIVSPDCLPPEVLGLVHLPPSHCRSLPVAIGSKGTLLIEICRLRVGGLF